MGMVCHKGLRFSQFGVVMSRPYSENLSPLWQPVSMKKVLKILKKEGFFSHPLYAIWSKIKSMNDGNPDLKVSNLK